ncbi:MAG: spore coat associated protein CotJA [Porcipelethomonas sp.]
MDYNMFDGLRFEPVSNMKKSSMNRTGRFPEHTPIGMAYVPVQEWEEPYEIQAGFEAGTIFPQLDLPFEPRGGYYDERKR